MRSKRFTFGSGGLVERIFTTLVAYFKTYICQPDCCKNNESVITMTIADCENPKTKEKLRSGEEILEKIINMEKNFFPNDKDKSIFGESAVFLQHLRQLLRIMLCNALDGKECWCCATTRIQTEELFHAGNIWYNTGRQNVYTTYEPFYSREMQQGFRMKWAPGVKRP